jgi:hypothetical protein
MRWGTSYGRSGARTGGSLFPFLSLILAPVIVAILTVAFLGYALWRLGYLLWQLMCLAWQAMRARRAPDASSRAATYS